MTRVSLLLVDDEPGYAEMVGARLEHVADVEVVAAVSAPDRALEYVEADPSIDCVVSDHDMPGMTGVELLEAVRERRPSLPFFLLTGTEDGGVAGDAAGAGATGYVRKTSGTEHYEALADRILAAVAAGESSPGARSNVRNTGDRTSAGSPSRAGASTGPGADGTDGGSPGPESAGQPAPGEDCVPDEAPGSGIRTD